MRGRKARARAARVNGNNIAQSRHSSFLNVCGSADFAEVAEVAVHWAADAAEYEIQTSLNGVQWTPISPRASALSGQTVRTVFPGNTPATQWIRIVPGLNMLML